MRTACMNDLRSGVCFLLRRVSNTASSFLKARDKQPQVRLFTSIHDFTRIAGVPEDIRIFRCPIAHLRILLAN